MTKYVVLTNSFLQCSTSKESLDKVDLNLQIIPENVHVLFLYTSQVFHGSNVLLVRASIIIAFTTTIVMTIE